MNYRLFRHLLVCLLSTTLVTNSNVIDAQGRKSTPSQKIAYGGYEGQLSDQGRSRTYYLYTPKSYHSHRGMPLVLVLHGHGGSGRSIAHTSRFNSLAEQKGFIVVYPDGIDQEWSLRDDVSFVEALIDRVQEIRHVDSRRIYVTGFSKGAILSHALACRLPNKIAAFASVAGALPARLKGNCQSPTPVSMFMINGTNDKSVRYEGDDDTQHRGALISVPGTIRFWRTHNGCPSMAQVRQLADPHLSDGLKVKTTQYAGCSAGSEVLLATVVGGGHLWPGGASDDVSVNKFNKKLGFNASKSIWDFFYRHHFPY